MHGLCSKPVSSTLFLVLLLLCFTTAASAQTSTFTYQGQLTEGGSAANGLYDLRFSLYDASSGGSLQGSPSTVTVTGVTVTRGVFSVLLDFGTNAFSGAGRYLDISVKHPEDVGYTALGARQQLNSSPYAIRTVSATSADALSSACVACVTDGQLSSNVVLKDATQSLTNKTIDSATNTVTADRLRTATTVVDVKTAAAPAAGQVLTATGPTSATWQAPATNWAVGGNVVAGTGTLGTTSNNHVDLVTNGLVRGRLSNLGEFSIGATGTVINGDLMSAVGNATFPWALNGYSSFNGGGVYGTVTAGTTSSSGVEGSYQGTGLGAGVFGSYVGTASGNTSPTGVTGYASPSTPGNRRIGVMGYYGSNHYGIGVAGLGEGGSLPAGNLDIGVFGGVANNAGYSGYFNGNHVIVNGTKSASVGTSQGNQLLYAMESPEVWFEDIGGGRLTTGVAQIQLDPLFLETVRIDEQHPMHVFIQMEGESEGVFVQKGATSFSVRERNGGASNAAFSYRVIARRLNFEDHRFGNDPVWGSGDTRAFSSYVQPPPVDHDANVVYRAEQRSADSWTPLPESFQSVDDFRNNTLAKRPVTAAPQTGK